MTRELRFDSVLPTEFPVLIGGKAYTLREASGIGMDAYRGLLANCTKIEDGKVSVVNPGKAMEAGKLLLSHCLFDPEGILVPLATIQGWPGRMSDVLVDAAVDLCGIIDKKDTVGDDEEAKNS